MKMLKLGENIACDISVIGCYLLKAGIVGKEKEEIKKICADIIIANRKNATDNLILEFNKDLDKIKNNFQSRIAFKFLKPESRGFNECSLKLNIKINKLKEKYNIK